MLGTYDTAAHSHSWCPPTPPLFSETDVVWSPHPNAVVAATLITANYSET